MSDQNVDSNKSRSAILTSYFIYSLVSLIIVIGLGLGLYFGYKKYEEMPKKIVNFYGVAIGNSEADVLVLHGKPDSESKTENDGKYFYKESRYFGKEFVGDSYLIRSTTLFKYKGLDENSLLVKQVCQYGKNPTYGVQWEVNDIEVGSSLYYLLERLGEPSSKDMRSDKLAAMYSYSQYNLFFVIEKGSVTSFCMTDGGNYVFSNR